MLDPSTLTVPVSDFRSAAGEAPLPSEVAVGDVDFPPGDVEADSPHPARSRAIAAMHQQEAEIGLQLDTLRGLSERTHEPVGLCGDLHNAGVMLATDCEDIVKES